MQPGRTGRARFLTFEGVDGAGKSTHARELAERLRAARIPVTITREPGGSPGAEAIRTLLLDAPSGRWDALSEALLIYAARRDHVQETILPAMARGEWVICDRFVDSSHAYQGAAGGVPKDFLDELDRTVLNGLRPDLTLVLDVPPTEGLARARGGRYERRGEEFQAEVRAAFREIAEREPKRCRLIDTRAAQREVAAAIWREVAPLIEGHDGPEAG